MQIDQTLHTVNPDSLSAILNVEKNKTSSPITIRSKKTGKDFTFKISRSEYQGYWYTHIKIERGGYLDFSHIGTYYDGQIHKNKEVVDTDGAKAIAWVLRNVELKRVNKVSEGVEVMHSGHCMACGRELTDAESIERGVGPVCAEGL